MGDIKKKTCIDDFNNLLASPGFLKNNKYNLSKYKTIIDNLKQSLDECNYKKIKDNYFIIYELYKTLQEKLNIFIADFIKSNKESNTYELLPIKNEEQSTTLIERRKSKADEIIEYDILFQIIDFYSWLSKFIYNSDTFFTELKKKIDFTKYDELKKNMLINMQKFLLIMMQKIMQILLNLYIILIYILTIYNLEK